jgi:two-component system cell cycle response regulator DivK
MAKKILIFEDDHEIIKILIPDFLKKGYIALISETFLEVIDQVKAFSPDLIIMNNFIPPIGGIGATQLLKNDLDFMHIPIILSSYKRNVRDMKISCGADEYLLKPFSLQQLNILILKYFNNN